MKLNPTQPIPKLNSTAKPPATKTRKRTNPGERKTKKAKKTSTSTPPAAPERPPTISTGDYAAKKKSHEEHDKLMKRRLDERGRPARTRLRFGMWGGGGGGGGGGMCWRGERVGRDGPELHWPAFGIAGSDESEEIESEDFTYGLLEFLKMVKDKGLEVKSAYVGVTGDTSTHDRPWSAKKSHTLGYTGVTGTQHNTKTVEPRGVRGMSVPLPCLQWAFVGCGYRYEIKVHDEDQVCFIGEDDLIEALRILGYAIHPSLPHFTCPSHPTHKGPQTPALPLSPISIEVLNKNKGGALGALYTPHKHGKKRVHFYVHPNLGTREEVYRHLPMQPT